RVRVDKVRDRIQSKLEWTIRRIEVQWHSSQKDFEKVHSLGSGPSAVTIKRNNFQKIHMGPSINDSQFDQIFAHELVLVIFAQKYKGAIPRWLEEGFANHLSQRKKVDYKWLSQQKFPTNITDLEHPFKNSPVSPKFHYRASQGLVEMLDKKCDLENLLRLSVERKMANYIQTYCEIKDINQAFKKWVDEKAKAS
ncbi:MAG: hypothetical protein HRT44_07510, partial [Bdellovibrionales bacterium]|nr:hypothetical protein [Bdellovibrionales bacterium]NQZ19085.1 hypothetical protein [Bdellovibrionales bacterium]